MLFTSVKNNLKSILRDPTTLLAFLAAFILCFMDGFDRYVGPDGSFIDTELYLFESTADDYARQTFAGFVSEPIHEMLFPFIAIVIAVNLCKDKRTETYDIISASQLSFRQYFFSKLISYYILSLGICLLMTVSYEICYIIIQIPPDPAFEWWRPLVTQAVAMIVLYSSVMFIPIAFSMFLFALTGNHIFGIVFNCVYRYIPSMFLGFGFTKWAHYVHTIPTSLRLYLQWWLELSSASRFALQHRLFTSGIEPYVYYTSFLDALIAYGTQIVIATMLFTASYFLLKKRFSRS